MAQIPEESLSNVEASLQVYLKTNFTDIPIRWSKVKFDEARVNAWVSPFCLVGGGRFHRQIAPGRLGKSVPVVYNLTLEAKQAWAEAQSSFYLQRLGTKLSCLFREPKYLTVNDHDGGNPNTSIGSILFYDTDVIDLGLNIQLSLYQYAVSATMIYLLQWEG